MSGVLIAGAATFASLIAMLVLTGWIVRRGRPRKGLQWSENAPKPGNRL